MGLTIPKRTVYPLYRSRELRFGLSELYDHFMFRHLRESGGELVCAEGTEEVASVSCVPAALYTVGNEVYVWSAQTLKLYRCTEPVSETNMTRKPNRLFSLYDRANKRYLCAVNGNAVTVVTDEESRTVASGKGGVCGAVFKERLFTAKGNKIFYSEPMQPDCWDEASGKGGYVELPADEGDFVGAVALREQLFFFRERGIVQLRAGGDELNFKAVPFRFGAGTIAPDTIADCGNAVYFFTDRGLFSFSGGACVQIERSLFSQMTGKPNQAASFEGNYYASCTHRVYGKCIYCYEPLTGRARFILCNVNCFAAGRGVWLTNGNTVSKLTAKGLPKSGSCELWCGLQDFGMSADERFFDGVRIDGAGTFTVTVQTERGESASAHGSAGETLRFPVLLRGGKFSLRVRAEGTDFKIRSLTVSAREA